MRTTKLAVALIAVTVLTAGCASTATPSRTPYAAFTPTPTPSAPATAPADSPTTVAPRADLTDGQRATLDVTFGRTGDQRGILDTYCPMDIPGRTYYADLVARQFDGYTTQTVLAYLEEVC